MANIEIDEVEDLFSIDDTFRHGKPMAVLSILGMPVLYGPAKMLDLRHRDEVLDELKPHIAKALAELLLAGGNLPGWQAEPVDVDPPH